MKSKVFEYRINDDTLIRRFARQLSTHASHEINLSAGNLINRQSGLYASRWIFVRILLLIKQHASDSH